LKNFDAAWFLSWRRPTDALRVDRGDKTTKQGSKEAMMFSRKSKPFDVDHELLVILDRAREAGMSARTIAAAFQARADAERQRDAVTRRHNGYLPQVFDGFGKPIVR
jgi:hypothetical protein